MTKPAISEIETFAAAKLAQLDALNIRRELTPSIRTADAGITRGGRAMISFCDNDYLGLSNHPRVVAAAVEATQLHGAGAGAARLVTGDHPLNHALEMKLSAMKRLPATRVFGSGYLANIGTIPVLAARDDLIVIDELAHSCMYAGALLSGADVAAFPHNDVAVARRLLSRRRGARGLLLTETVFSMDGDLAPLQDLSAVCAETGSWLMTDDAHGLGVVEIDNPAPIQMGTLSKSAGAYGGYVAGPAAFIDLLTSRARSFVYTTGLPPGVLASALAALEIMEEQPELGAHALANARLFGQLVGCPSVESAIVPIIVGSAELALAASAQLANDGFVVTAIRPPTVPDGAARLRFTFSALHAEGDIRRLAGSVVSILSKEVVRQ